MYELGDSKQNERKINHFLCQTKLENSQGGYGKLLCGHLIFLY